MKEMKNAAKGIADEKKAVAVDTKDIRKIVFACDAGMGSSAMGATVLKKKLTAAGLGGIEVMHSPVSVSYTHLGRLCKKGEISNGRR